MCGGSGEWGVGEDDFSALECWLEGEGMRRFLCCLCVQYMCLFFFDMSMEMNMRVVACEWMDGLDADPITSLFISFDMNSSSMVVFE